MSGTIEKITGQMLESDLLREGEDLTFDTDLVTLYVNSRRVGINDALAPATRPLTVGGTFNTTSITVPTQTTFSNLVITTDTITNSSNDIYLSATGPNSTIVAGKIYTSALSLDNNNITSRTTNSDINLVASGSGEITALSNVLVNANLHATGDVTFDGDITFGNNNLDSLSFNADISSNIIPNVTDTYSLGGNGKRFNEIRTNLVNGEAYQTGGSFAGGVDLSLRVGNTWYVAVNGSYSNVGDHPNGPFDTIEKALSVATAGDTIMVYPGTYYELLPLVVPAGVTVRGDGIRSVKVVPDTASTHEDVFLLNGECTVEDLTVADFYYDSLNDKGYAFRFAPGFKVTSRSPYLRNISVITKGSITSVGDPLGYDQSDAGRGAFIDGSVADPTSREASLLFHSATFICPGAKCLTLTNGVRIEWLNSFIYYASEGLVAETGASGFAGDGKTKLKIYGISAQTVNPGDTVSVENVSLTNVFTTGIVESVTYSGVYTNIVIDGLVTGWEESASPPDTSNQQQILFSGGQTASHLEWVDYSDFGGEIRSIGSANVYGNIGAKVDGVGNLMYLIGHNFGYIGAGKNTTNDPSDVIQANEIIRLNGGEIYYQSMDHIGNFRVGDIFLVESATGKITFESEFIGSNSLTFTDGGYTTYIDAFEVSTGNFTISGNTIQSNTGPINLNTATGLINVTSNTNISQSLTVSNNALLNADIVIGNSSSDKLAINAEISSDLIPKTNLLTVGSNTNRWKTLWASQTTFDNIVINDNVIDATLSNSNLELRANGTGFVRFEQLDFKNNSITTSTSNTDINITATGTGKIKLTTDTDITGDLTTTGNVFVQGNITLGDNSVIDTINPIGVIGSDLIPQTTGTYNIGSPTSTWKTLYLSYFINDDIEINDNYIRTTASNANLELRANGTGSIRIDSIDIKNNKISANTTNSDLSIQANGTGTLELLSTTSVTGNLTVSNNATINSNTQFGDVNLDQTTINAQVISNLIPSVNTGYDLGTTSNRWNVYAGMLLTDSIEINDNYIRTTESNSNLEFISNGLGAIRIDQLDFKNNAVTANTLNTDVNVTPTGTGRVKLNSSTDILGNFTVSNLGTFNGNMLIGDASTDTTTFISRISSNVVPLTTSTYNLGTNNLRWTSLYSSAAVIDDITIDTNVIQSTLSNQNLELRANGTGSIQIDQLNFKSNLISSNTTNTDIQINPNGAGEIELLKDTVVTGNLEVSGNINVDGNITIGDQTGDTINLVASISSNIIPSLNSVYNIGASNYRWNNIHLSQLFIDDIVIDTNVIQSTLSNQNLELRTSGTGSIRIDQLDIASNLINSNTPNTDIEINPNGTGKIQLLKDTNITGNLDVTGDINVNGNIQIGDQSVDSINFIGKISSDLIPQTTGTYNIGSDILRWKEFFASNLVIDDIEINDNYIRTTTSNTNLELRVNGTGLIRIDNLDIKSNIISANAPNTDINLTATGTGRIKLNVDTDITGNLTTTGNILVQGNVQIGDQVIDTINPIGVIASDLIPSPSDTQTVGNTLTSWRAIYLSNLIVDDIEFNDNVIRTTASNSNLEIRASNASATVLFEQFGVRGNTLRSASSLQFQTQGTGVVRFQNNVEFFQNLTVTGDTFFNSNSQIGNSLSNLTTFTATINSDVLPSLSSAYDLGNDTNKWQIFSNGVISDIVEFNDNYITTNTSNADLDLRAHGTGSIRVASNNLILDSGLTVNGLSTLLNTNINGNLTVTGPFTVLGNFSSNELTTGDILINDNYITTTLSNSNLELRADNTGGVILDQSLKITNSSIENVLGGTETNSSIIFNPYAGQSVSLANSQTALKIPVGNNTTRTLTTLGEIRLNNTNSQFEGRIASTVISLYSVFDADRNTYITAELTPGANDNTFRLVTNNLVQATITANASTFNQLKVDEITVNARLISTSASNADIELRANGTGKLKVDENLAVDQSSITNLTSDAATQIVSTGNGYVKFAGDQALRIPAGNNSQQPVAPPIAATRWNTEETYLEVWDGTAWISAAGLSGATVSEAEMNDLTSLYSIIFG